MKDNIKKFPKRFKFDSKVVARFDDMISRSIPFHDMMRASVEDVAGRFLRKTDGLVVDIGCSNGLAIRKLVDHHPGSRFLGLETSRPMIESFKKSFTSYGNKVGVQEHDLRKGFPREFAPVVVLSILTLQFVPVNYRQRIVAEIFRSLRPGGAFILVEKVMGETAETDEMMVDIYHSLKALKGYSYEQIERKKAALEGVLVPLTAAWNEGVMAAAGFSGVECFWRWMNFVGWVGVKRG